MHPIARCASLKELNLYFNIMNVKLCLLNQEMSTCLPKLFKLTTSPALPPISEPTDFGKDKPTSRCHFMFSH